MGGHLAGWDLTGQLNIQYMEQRECGEAGGNGACEAVWGGVDNVVKLGAL